ncbi:exodeoxyribonuclease VII small subunit [Gudongella sp. DL1XJH-153]|uniref:exodeoxyribonuclease VII small subunit n=1 Tax=Gudongella sp. DL1XJH-153 TaxID=3409804 RepID=UPI003BB75CC6
MDTNKLTYEEGMKLLQELLEELEKEDLKLDETIKKFKEAMKVYDHCNEILTKAEGDVKMILDKGMGVEEVDFPEMFGEEPDDEF